MPIDFVFVYYIKRTNTSALHLSLWRKDNLCHQYIVQYDLGKKVKRDYGNIWHVFKQ